MIKKKVLFIITHLELGGAQTQLFSIIKNLNSNKYSLYLCTGNSGYLNDEFRGIKNLNIYFIPELVREIHPFYDIIAFLKLYFYVRKNKFDIVHTHSPKASFLGRWSAFLCGVQQIVYTVHGWPFHNFMNPLSFILFFYLEKISALVTKKIIVVSKYDLKTAVDKRVTSLEKLVLVHYGVDINLFESLFERRKEKIFTNKIINISALKFQKGLERFLAAARFFVHKDKRIKFLLIGDGPARKKIESAINDYVLSDQVILTGWMRDVLEVFLQADLLILTSLWEGLPVVVIEAVLSGIPVVVTDTGGVRDIIKNDINGIIVPARDVNKIIQAVETIINNYKEWKEKILKERNSFNIEYWSEIRMVRETENIYNILE